MKNEYTELEKKIINRGIRVFREELNIASRPMLSVLTKYGVTHGHDLLEKITLSYPYGGTRDMASYDNRAVKIPNDAGLESLVNTILENFIKEVNELGDRIDDLEI